MIFKSYLIIHVFLGVKDAVESEKLQELLDLTLRKTEEFKLPAEVFKVGFVYI